MVNGTSPQRAPRPWKRLTIIGVLLLALVGVGVLYSHREAIVGRLLNSHFVGGDPGAANVRLPAGFHATIFASGLQGPRLLSPGPDGAILVAERGAGRVVALLDPDASGKATRTVVVADGLDDPTSVDYSQGAV
jgi:glucose/arabinose dehydrogenase